jgi:hypothetical protein
LSNDPAFNTRFYLVETTLLFAPVIAYLGHKLNSWLRPRHFANFLALSLVLVGGAIFFNLSNWSFRSDTASLFLGGLGYLAAVSVLFAFASRAENKELRWALRTIFSIPIVLGLGLGTVGVLGLTFIIGDSTPRQEATLNPQYGYRICFTGGGYTRTNTAELDIVKYPGFLPIQKTVWHRSFDEREYEYHNGVRVALSLDGRQVLVTLAKQGGGQVVEHFDLR